MTTEAIIVTLVSSLISGLVGVIVSSIFYRRFEQRKIKLETARKLFGNKYDMESTGFKEAMNEVMIVYADSETVVRVMKDLWEVLATPKASRAANAADDKLVTLMKSVCGELNIKHKGLDDQYYLRSFGGR